ncbi:Sec-independent protein secretion pathway component [Opitutaceae bacterium TAV1]|nr:Sec-independent protein secretion pathway component [Opitutaceae bacterium TAV1]
MIVATMSLPGLTLFSSLFHSIATAAVAFPAPSVYPYPPSPLAASGTLAFLEGIGSMELLLIFVLGLVLFGGKGLPNVARGLGRAMREFKKATSGVEEEIKRAMEEPPPRPRRRKPVNGTAASRAASRSLPAPAAPSAPAVSDPVSSVPVTPDDDYPPTANPAPPPASPPPPPASRSPGTPPDTLPL